MKFDELDKKMRIYETSYDYCVRLPTLFLGICINNEVTIFNANIALIICRMVFHVFPKHWQFKSYLAMTNAPYDALLD